MDTCALPQVSSLIRISADQQIFAPPRSFSQLVTSFVGSQCQGIRLMLFFTWPFARFNPFWLCCCSLTPQLHTNVCAFLAHSRASSSPNSNFAVLCVPCTALAHGFLLKNLFWFLGWNHRIYPSLAFAMLCVFSRFLSFLCLFLVFYTFFQGLQGK